MTKTKRNYTVMEKKCLAIMWAIKMFRPYIYEREFEAITNHKALKWLLTMKEPKSTRYPDPSKISQVVYIWSKVGNQAVVHSVNVAFFCFALANTPTIKLKGNLLDPKICSISAKRKTLELLIAKKSWYYPKVDPINETIIQLLWL